MRVIEALRGSCTGFFLDAKGRKRLGQRDALLFLWARSSRLSGTPGRAVSNRVAPDVPSAGLEKFVCKTLNGAVA